MKTKNSKKENCRVWRTIRGSFFMLEGMGGKQNSEALSARMLKQEDLDR